MLDLPTRTTTIMVVVPSLVPAGTPGPRLVGLEIIPRWKEEYTTWFAIRRYTYKLLTVVRVWWQEVG